MHLFSRMAGGGTNGVSSTLGSSTAAVFLLFSRLGLGLGLSASSSMPGIAADFDTGNGAPLLPRLLDPEPRFVCAHKHAKSRYMEF